MQRGQETGREGVGPAAGPLGKKRTRELTVADYAARHHQVNPGASGLRPREECRRFSNFFSAIEPR